MVKITFLKGQKRPISVVEAAVSDHQAISASVATVAPDPASNNQASLSTPSTPIRPCPTSRRVPSHSVRSKASPDVTVSINCHILLMCMIKITI